MCGIWRRIQLPALWLLSAIAPSAGVDLEELARRAGAALAVNDFAAAEREYRTILDLHPELAEMRSNLGIALHMQCKDVQAEKEFRSAARLNSKLFVPNYFVGVQLFKTNRYREGRTFL